MLKSGSWLLKLSSVIAIASYVLASSIGVEMHIANFMNPLRTLCENSVLCHFHKPFILNESFIYIM